MTNMIENQFTITDGELLSRHLTHVIVIVPPTNVSIATKLYRSNFLS